MPKNQKSSCINICSNYSFLLWDGLGFFGFSDVKLNRLKGIKPRWFDRFTVKRWVVMNLIIFLLFAYILFQVFLTLGDVKS